MEQQNKTNSSNWLFAECERLQKAISELYKRSTLIDILMVSWLVASACWLLFSELLTTQELRLLSCFVILVLIAAYYYQSTRKILLVLAIALISFSWSGWQFTAHKSKVLPQQYESIDIELVGQVIGLPNKNSERTQFEFRLDQPSNTEFGDWASDETILLSCYRCPWVFESGDQWSLTVRLKRPRGYASWGSFDYEKFLFRKQIVAKGYVRTKAENSLLAKKTKYISQLRSQTKAKLLAQLQNNEQPQKESRQVAIAMILALAIGDKSELSSKARQVFQVTGVSHLFAISGLHVGLMFLVVAWLTAWSSRLFPKLYYISPRQHLVLLPGLMAAFYYAALSGFAVSTQRALIMLAVFVFCKWSYRPTPLLRVLLIAATLILIYDPFSILDIGFWLSCGAVFVIAVSSARFNELKLVTLQPLLWLGMMPLSILLLPQLSLVSPLVNLICVPIFCLLLIPLLLFALACTQLGLNQISVHLLSIVSDCFEFIYQGLAWIAESNYVSVSLPELSLWLLLIVAVLLIVSLFAIRIGVVLIAACLSLNFFFDRSVPSDYQVTLLDVGQGLSMVIKVDDYTLLYDVGPAYPSGFNTADTVVLPFLKFSGVNKIDHLVISHADHDHIGALEPLLNSMPVTQISTSRTDRVANSESCKSNQQWQVGSVQFEFLSPDENTPQGSNNRSCALSISNGKVRTLITGDIEKQVERYLLNSEHDLRSQIMLVPHQGSKTSSTEAFIDAVKPAIALVAAGYRNHYGHPHPKVVARYQKREIELLSTIEHGSIHLIVDSERISQQSYRIDNARFWHD